MGTDLVVMPQTGIDIQRSAEFNGDAAMMRAQQEVQGSIIIAKRFPRNEDEAAQALWRACKRSSFAERAEYKFPRGKKKNEQTGQWEDNIVSGPSVTLAREAMRLWGNMDAGTEIVRDTEKERHIRSFAWDKQTNVRKVSEATFGKLIQRKVSTGKKDDRGWDIKETQWVPPDERDLRELQNKHGAIAERNCILNVIPADVVEEALRIARETLRKEAAQDPDAARRRLISGFDELNITVGMLEAFLQHPLGQCTPKEIADLRAIWVSIRDGNSTWAELMKDKVDDVLQYITSTQALEFFRLSKASGYTDEDRKAFIAGRWKIENGDSLKIPAEDWEEAKKWASTAKTAAPAQQQATDDPAVLKKIQQLFEILEMPEMMQTSMIADYAGRLPELEKVLNEQLPTD